MTFGEKIKNLRLQTGLSQAQLADELFVSRAAVAKWENENGMPDISNIKALANFFHCDLDSLLDDGKNVEMMQDAVPVVEPNTYCGKSCEVCTYKEKLSCPGCKAGPGHLDHGSCEISKCCKNHIKANCNKCIRRNQCGMVKDAESKPRQRERKLRQELALEQTLQRQAPIFGKWLWFLFWLIILINLADILSQDWFADFPAVILIGNVLSILCMLLYALTMLCLSREMDRFKTAGICYWIMSGVYIISLIVTNITNIPGEMLLCTLPVKIASLIGTYQECMGCSEILMKFHVPLSEKWELLWKINKWLYIVMFGSILFAAFMPMLVVFVMLICVLGLLIASVVKQVFLYQSAKFFRNVSW